VFFCPVADPAFTITWLLRDVPLMITHIYLVLDLWVAIIKHTISPFRPELHNHAKDISLSTDGLSS
jgi:hypothetical protein